MDRQDRQDSCIGLERYWRPPTVIPAYAGIPRLLADNTIIRQYRGDSRLRGNDGRATGGNDGNGWRDDGSICNDGFYIPPYPADFSEWADLGISSG